MRFVFVGATSTTALLVVVLAYRDLVTDGGVGWWGALLLLPLTALFVSAQGALAVLHWSAILAGTWLDRSALTLMRALWLALSIGPFLILAIAAPSMDAMIFWIALPLGSSVLPFFLLAVARRRRVGPGCFALQKALAAGERAAARLRSDIEAVMRTP